MTGATESPDRFMYVMGFRSSTFCPANMPVASSPLNDADARHSAPISRAMAFTTSNPIECGVFSYCAPGLPNPAMTFI